MRYAHEVAKVRAAEQALMARSPEGALMAMAAAGLGATCARLLGSVYGARVVVLAGRGDNGGDALYAAQRLARRGARTHAVLTGSRVHPGGAAALRIAGGPAVAAADQALPGPIGQADLIIHRMLGIRRPRGPPWPASALARPA